MLVYRRADTPLLLKEVTNNDEVDVEIINVELSVGGGGEMVLITCCRLDLELKCTASV